VSTQAISVGGVVSNYLTISITHPIGRDDVNTSAECCATLTSWAPAILVGPPVFNGDGTETITWRHTSPKPADLQQFLRLHVTRLP
jgi:hypothetical protein